MDAGFPEGQIATSFTAWFGLRRMLLGRFNVLFSLALSRATGVSPLKRAGNHSTNRHHALKGRGYVPRERGRRQGHLSTATPNASLSARCSSKRMPNSATSRRTTRLPFRKKSNHELYEWHEYESLYSCYCIFVEASSIQYFRFSSGKRLALRKCGTASFGNFSEILMPPKGAGD